MIVIKIYKVLWLGCFIVICKFKSFVFKLLLLTNNVKFGKKVRAQGTATPQLRISYKAKDIQLGDNVTFNNYNDAGWNSRCSIWVKSGATLRIGNNTGFNGVLVYAANSITIGNNVKVGGGTRIFDTDFHPLDYEIRRTSNEGTKSSPIIIEDDVFIGAGCFILKGVTIGARSIIAAGSVVTKNIPADEIWGGNPAKFIRKINE